MLLTHTEQLLVKKLNTVLSIIHVPVYRNGELVNISGIPDDDIYEKRQFAYNARLFISDEILYNLDDVDSIYEIEIPHFKESSKIPNVSFDLSYVLKMAAGNEKNPELLSPLAYKVIVLMLSSPISYQRKDYMYIIEQLWKANLIADADYLESKINCINFSNSTFSNIFEDAKKAGTDLVVTSQHYGTCRECSILQNRVYSISGKSNIYPKLPNQVHIFGSFHNDCRHRFFPFFHKASILQIYSDDGQKLIQVDPVQYSNRPYIDTRTKEEKEAYIQYCLRKRSDINFENLKREYYHQRNYDDTSVPKTFSAYMKEKNFKHIV